MSPSTASGPPAAEGGGATALRADAARNRERILEAARRLFGERGLEVEMSEIAAEAGVGVGTLYRRFPDRSALVDELLREKFAVLAATLERQLGREVSARERLEGFLRDSCEIQCGDRGLMEALSFASDRHEEIARATPGLVESMQRLAADAVAEGGVRADLSWEDLVVCVCALGDAISDEGRRPGSWERLLEIMLAGLGPTAG